MSIKVLIVEDNHDYRELIDVYLVLKGFTVLTACNGRDAVELAQKGAPHIILMDLNLPILDGWEATRVISQNPATSHIPIIVISAFCSDYDLKKAAIKAGAAGCLTKPVDIEALFNLILSFAA